MEPIYPDFTREEFEQRWAKARAKMAEQDIDALFITERLNYQYFSGHRSCQNPIDKIRSYMFILPKDDEPSADHNALRRSCRSSSVPISRTD